MTAKTNAFENLALNIALRGQTAVPAAIDLALFTADPGEAGSIDDEVSGDGYGRQSITFDAPVDGLTQNTGAVLFPKSITAWGTITHFALIEDMTNNIIYYGALTTPKTVGIGDQLNFPIGSVTVQET